MKHLANQTGDLPRIEVNITASFATEARLLVVDDEDFVRETLADMLIDLDHKVVMVNSGAAACQRMTRLSA